MIDLYNSNCFSILDNVGDTVLRCFMGSGTTGVACRDLGRNFIDIEKIPNCKR